MLRISFILILISIISISLLSQQDGNPDTIQVTRVEIADELTIMNIGSRIEDERIIVTYDLLGTDVGRIYEISFRVNIEPDTNYQYKPKKISGDSGRGVKPGRGKKIIWDYKREIEQDINVDELRFRITIQYYRRRIPSKYFYYIAGAGIAAGGFAIYYLIVNNGKNDEFKFPHPPDRPN